MCEARRCSGSTNLAFACSWRWRSAASSATAGSGSSVELTSTYSIETVSGARYPALLASYQLATCASVTGAVSSAGGGSTTNAPRSEEHTSELQSLMRISYAVLCLKKKKHISREEHIT